MRVQRPVAHYDSDFPIAADVFDFEHRWVLPRATRGTPYLVGVHQLVSEGRLATYAHGSAGPAADSAEALGEADPRRDPEFAQQAER
jgi:hypothetical protein